ncbi:response regulator [Deinococcus pimensis]|uniref:response regulator n=1 Tax=Deinococcus pimensis TaxID=309888 RepID=UPI000481AE64|nr:response regulator [Deinococcus pimensis]
MDNSGRILLVEDNELDVELARLAFAARGLDGDVTVARDGQEALDYLHAEGEHAGRPDHVPSLVLLDLHMPRLSGYEVLRRVKADPRLKSVPIVVFTTSDADFDRGLCDELGADAYLCKPFDFLGLVDVVDRLASTWLPRSA